MLLAALVLTLLISELSYRVVETPIRRRGFIAPLAACLRWLATPWHRSRLPRVVAGGLAGVLLLSVAAVLTAPEKSATQQQIETAEADLANASPLAPGETPARSGVLLGDPTAARPAPASTPRGAGGAQSATQPSAEPAPPSATTQTPAEWGWTKDDEGLLVPQGADITAIGDSLVVTSADGLTYRFPGITYAAKSNRQWKDAGAVVEQALAGGAVRDNVILHFGTNAGVDQDQAEAVLDLLGPQRRVVLMNLYGSSSFIPRSNEIVTEIAAERPNVVVGDWNSAATASPQTLQSDRIHPDIAGMHVYARAVAQAFDTLAKDVRAPGTR